LSATPTSSQAPSASLQPSYYFYESQT
jgi:hypothetical protein